MQNVMCGPHPNDITSLRPKLELPSPYEPIDDWKIAYSNDLGSFEVDKDVLANLHATLDVFRSLGATVEEVDLGWSEATLQAGLDHLSQFLRRLYPSQFPRAWRQDDDLRAPHFGTGDEFLVRAISQIHGSGW